MLDFIARIFCEANRQEKLRLFFSLNPEEMTTISEAAKASFLLSVQTLPTKTDQS